MYAILQEYLLLELAYSDRELLEDVDWQLHLEILKHSRNSPHFFKYMYIRGNGAVLSTHQHSLFLFIAIVCAVSHISCGPI